MYNLPEFNFTNIKKRTLKIIKNRIFLGVLCLTAALGVLVYFAYATAWQFFPSQTQVFLQNLKNFKIPQIRIEIVRQAGEPESPSLYVSKISYEQAIIDAAKNMSPSVVSIVVSKMVPVYEEQWINPFEDEIFSPFNFQIPQQVQKGTKYQQVGAGSGFIVSEDGLVLTNKHVVLDSKADYVVFTNDGQEYPAQVMALDPMQDLAVLKIDSEKIFNPAVLGDSGGIQIGQTVVAIGNALGQFSNTVSVGVVSGLGRTISASDQKGLFSETLEDIIQTDAAINSGNSGGPLLNLNGEVIGVNVAMAEGAQSIGFALPINLAKRAIKQVKENSKIIYPFLGVRFVLVNDKIKKEYNLPVSYGALILKGNNGDPAVMPESAAQEAGIKENDVVLEINGEKIAQGNSMSQIVQKYNPGDAITLHILRQGKEMDIEAVLGQRSS